MFNTLPYISEIKKNIKDISLIRQNAIEYVINNNTLLNKDKIYCLFAKHDFNEKGIAKINENNLFLLFFDSLFDNYTHVEKTEYKRLCTDNIDSSNLNDFNMDIITYYTEDRDTVCSIVVGKPEYNYLINTNNYCHLFKYYVRLRDNGVKNHRLYLFGDICNKDGIYLDDFTMFRPPSDRVFYRHMHTSNILIIIIPPYFAFDYMKICNNKISTSCF